MYPQLKSDINIITLSQGGHLTSHVCYLSNPRLCIPLFALKFHKEKVTYDQKAMKPVMVIQPCWLVSTVSETSCSSQGESGHTLNMSCSIGREVRGGRGGGEGGGGRGEGGGWGGKEGGEREGGREGEEGGRGGREGWGEGRRGGGREGNEYVGLTPMKAQPRPY